MMDMANDKPGPSWSNFAAWSAVGAVFCGLAMWGSSALLHEDGMGAVFRSSEVVATVSLVLILASAVIGFGGRKRPLSLRAFRNFLIQNAVALSLFLLALWGFKSFGGAMAGSEGVAALTGLLLVVLAFVGSFAVASVHVGGNLVEDEMAADDLRDRGRLMICSLAWTAACGLLLIGLSLAGPGGVLSPAAALAGALVLIGVLTVLGVAAWRLSDELGRTLSHETGNMAFYLIWVIGGLWAMLAHLGVVAAPAPLGWVTMFTVLLFAASFIVLGRRGLFNSR